MYTCIQSLMHEYTHQSRSLCWQAIQAIEQGDLTTLASTHIYTVYDILQYIVILCIILILLIILYICVQQ